MINTHHGFHKGLLERFLQKPSDKQDKQYESNFITLDTINFITQDNCYFPSTGPCLCMGFITQIGGEGWYTHNMHKVVFGFMPSTSAVML